jgi:hypothetical protein
MFHTDVAGVRYGSGNKTTNQVEVFRVVTSSSVAEGYKRFGEPYCIHQEESSYAGCSLHHRKNINIHKGKKLKLSFCFN